MALFKISKGKSTDLGIKNGTNKTTEGYAYFTPDDGKFYIDIATANTVELGTNRIVLNSFKADLSQSFTVNLTERSSFWTLNIPGLKELKEGLILHISIPTRPNDVYNVLNINGLGNKMVYYKYNEPLGDKIQIPAELTLIYREDASSIDQIFKNYNNDNDNDNDINYGKSGWIIDSSYSINKADIYYGNLAGNATTATQLYHTPYHQDVFLRGDNVWTNKFIGSLNVTDNINTNQITFIDKDIITNESFTIDNKNFSQIYAEQENVLIGDKINITNLNRSSYFEEIFNNNLYPDNQLYSWEYDTVNNYWHILNTQDKHSLFICYSWRALSNFVLNINIRVHSESISYDYLIIQVNEKEKKRVGGNNQIDNITLFLKANDIVNFIIQKDGSANPSNEYYRAVLSYQEYASVYTIKVNKNFIPENNQQTLGTPENKWSKLYIGSYETYGSISQPIYWNDGVPTGITTLGIEYGGTNTTSFTNNHLIIYNNSQLQSFEAEADSEGKYLKSQGADKPPIWSELSITLNSAVTDSPSFYAPTTCGDGQGYYLQSGGQQQNDDGSYIYNPPIWSKMQIDYNHTPTDSQEYYLIGSNIQPIRSESTSSQPMISKLYAHQFVKIDQNGYLTAPKVYNAVWNDYAEYRQTNNIQPGKVYQENDNGCMTLTNQRLIPGCSIASDTFGSAMGKTLDAQTPMAVAGRVLAYTYQNRSLYHAGMAVCSAPNGTIDIMSREEIIAYPDCIIGYVSEIPEYEEWGSGHVQVDGRIWIKIK